MAKPSDLTSYIRTELKGTEQGKLEEAVENGKPGIRVAYAERLASDVAGRCCTSFISPTAREVEVSKI